MTKLKLIVDSGSSSYFYQTDKTWTFSLEDDKSQQFGISYEIRDMDECTGDPEFKDYKFVVSASIMAHKVHKSFNELDTDQQSDLETLRYDCEQYMGGVPVDHILQSTEDSFKNLAEQFNVFEAKVVTHTAQFGTFAAQNGKGAEHSYLQFKTHAAAKKFIDILATRSSIMRGMIGFILDQPINMLGEDGWSVIRKQVKGHK